MYENVIRMKRGSNRAIRFFIDDEDGNDVDLTGATLTFTVKRKLKDSAAIFTIASANFNRALQTTGIVTAIITDTQSDILGTYYAELKVEHASGRIHPLPEEGYIKLIVWESLA
jgi:3-deoxy-D-manno-octulosonate 8-phosphate phosphatase KdsC-like HAD superfamily phosphatase